MSKEQKPATTTQEHKKPDAHPHAQAQAHGKGKDKGASTVIHCGAEGCKKAPARFDFCDEHYDQFKFGLIKKTGQPVPDYEKKIEHYLAYKQKQGARKVA